MTTKDEALKLALEALDVLLTEPIAHKAADRAEYLLLQAAPAIREALAEQPAQGCEFCSHPLSAGTKCKHCGREQPAQQEPVAWKDKIYGNLHHQDFGNSIPLYTSPPTSKPWVGLTPKEKKEIERLSVYVEGAIRYTEAKLREKNA